MSTTRPTAHWRAGHGMLMLLLLLVPHFTAGLTRWPLFLLVPLLGYGLVVFLVPPMRRSCTAFAIGRCDRYTLAATLGIVLLSSLALVLFQAAMRPDVTALAAQLPLAALGNVFSSGVCFAVVNAALEQATVRGVLY